ncbi:conjugal transfer protein [Clostridium sp. Marseille-P2415]|uniref:conjugal transfer protein n=1 Tax=Clostridium sp. Marseille-P2415 TaxID=1805471 RepID=UPI001115A76B
MNLRKKQGQTEQVKEKRLRVYKVNTHKKTVIVLWVLLAVSFCFAIYKNFTAIDVHTVHETKVVEEKIMDTHKIENFVEDFAKAYYSWEQTAVSIDNRNEAIKYYLTAELQALNTDTIRKDIPVSSSVREVQIWSVSQDGENQFNATFTVDQLITEGENQKTIRSVYEVVVYVDGSGNMVITKNPTICSVPEKSGYEPKAKESDGTVDAATTNEINEFLTTFFKLYPTATAKELSYYVKDGVLKPIRKEYVFSELINLFYNKSGNQVTVSLAVKYLDNQTKAIQISQFDLVLEKDENWKIIN